MKVSFRHSSVFFYSVTPEKNRKNFREKLDRATNIVLYFSCNLGAECNSPIGGKVRERFVFRTADKVRFLDRPYSRDDINCFKIEVFRLFARPFLH